MSTATALREVELHFKLSGEFLTDFLRARVLERAWRQALRVLVDDIEGVTYDLAIQVLRGEQRFVDVDGGMDLVADSAARSETKKYLDTLRFQYRYVYRTAGDQYWQPYAIVDNWGPPDIRGLRRSRTEIGIIEVDKELRSAHYKEDPRDRVESVVQGGRVDPRWHWTTFYLVRPVDPPPWLRFPFTLDAVIRKHGRDEDGVRVLRLPRTGYMQAYYSEAPHPFEKPAPSSESAPEQPTGPPRDPMVPDWERGSWTTSRSQGTLAEVVPQPVIRRYPHPGCPRPVQVSISTWVGTSVGARHWYCEIQEAHNPVWDGREGCWVELTTDTEGRGRHFPNLHGYDTERMNFVDQPDRSAYDQAKQWAQQIINEHFTGPDYRVEVTDYGCIRDGEMPWQPHEGD